MSDQLPILYEKIAALTAPACHNGTSECAQFCGKKYRCCERQYCEATRTFAKEKYGIDLQETGHPELPFMGENGCSVAPHLRPICSMHTCHYSWAPVSHFNHDEQQLKEYKQLRDEVLTEARLQGKEPF